MTPPDQGQRTARATLFLAVVLTTIGTCGTGQGITNATNAPIEGIEIEEDDVAVAEAAAAVRDELNRILTGHRHRRQLGAANIVVSVMLLIGGMLLITRRRQAIWWNANALVANLLYTLVEASVLVHQLVVNRDSLGRLLDAQIAAAQATAGGEAVPYGGSHVVWLYVLMLSGYGFFRCAIYLLLAWSVRRPSIQELLDQAARERAR